MNGTWFILIPMRPMARLFPSSSLNEASEESEENLGSESPVRGIDHRWSVPAGRASREQFSTAPSWLLSPATLFQHPLGDISEFNAKYALTFAQTFTFFSSLLIPLFDGTDKGIRLPSQTNSHILCQSDTRTRYGSFVALIPRVPSVPDRPPQTSPHIPSIVIKCAYGSRMHPWPLPRKDFETGEVDN